jgi:peroxiredoxin (alkyl hydroperoxide reductase subunit C)
MLTVGDKFPDFKLDGVQIDSVKEYGLTDISAKWAFVFFYPEDFTFVCPTEAIAFEKHKQEVEKEGALIIGVSVDDVDTHKAWVKEIKVSYPLLSDPKYELTNKLGILDTDNRAMRATFIVDPEGIIQFSMVTSRNVGRSVEETIRVFEALQSGRMCPADFKP